MLKSIKLTNFRCFKDHEIVFSDFNVLVGKNNSGKSTIVDALKLISNVCRYGPYRQSYLKDRDIPFSVTNLRYNYEEKEDTIIRASFSDDVILSIVFPTDAGPHAQVSKHGYPVGIGTLSRHSLGVIPPVGTFDESETMLSEKYLRSVMISHLTPLHFRNIWYYFKEDFEEFQRLVQETWPGYSIEPPEFLHTANIMEMFYTEHRMTREVFWAGHGFQVWLQLMTFLVKLGRVDILVLDEPDIYLHSDMQKKLVNVCRQRSNQVIIATHAVDIIEEVDPEHIICIDKDSPVSEKLSNIGQVQTVVSQLGSLQNLKLVHFVRGKTCLFVEGNDYKYLRILALKQGHPRFANEDHCCPR